MKPRALLVTGLLVVLGSSAALAYLLERHAAYRSPLRVEYPVASHVPRTEGLEALATHRREREAAAREREELLASLTTEKMVQLGREIVHGRGLCFNCHAVGTEGHGIQGPNLDGVAERAASRVEGLSALEYLVQSLYEPNAFVVSGYAATMTPANEAPISLDKTEILMVAAYLESLGGIPTVSPGMETPLGLGGP